MVEELRLNKETLSQQIGRAIKTGAPLFNQGDKKACYDIYLETAKNAQAQEMLDLTVSDLFSKAVPEAEALGDIEDYVEGAWVLRRCFDKVLKIEAARIEEEKREELRQLAIEVESIVDIADRKHRLKTYEKCFVGRDAVTKLLENEIASSRTDATKKMNDLYEAGYIEHVTKDHRFQDAKLFYRFNPNISKAPKKPQSAVVPSSDRDILAAQESHNIQAEAVAAETEQGAETLVEESHVEEYNKQAENQEEGEVTETTAESSVEEAHVKDKQDEEPAAEGEPTVEEHDTEKEDETLEDDMGDAKPEEPEEEEDSMIKKDEVEEETPAEPVDEEGRWDYSSERIVDTEDPLDAPVSRVEHDSIEDLAELAERLEGMVEIRNRNYRLKTYENCFIGKDAVTWLVDTGICTSRTDATKKLNDIRKAGFLEHVTQDHEFEDAKLFYRFIKSDQVVARSFSNLDSPPVSGKFSESGSVGKAPSEPSLVREKLGEPGSAQLALQIKRVVDIADRKHRLKTYKSCFVGKDAVTKLVDEKFFVNRTEATNQLASLRKAGFIEHVTGDHDFEDAALFYRFTPNVEKSVRGINNEGPWPNEE